MAAATDATTSQGTAHVIGSDAEALEIARAFAALIAPGAIERDRERRLPYAELEQLGRSGLLALRVPREQGGAGASNATIVETFRIVSVADPAIGQIPQNHHQWVDAIVRYGDDAQRARFLGEVVRGARFGNATSERGGANALDIRTRITPDPAGGYRLDGTKYYSTGALTAQWIPVIAREGEDFVLVYVARDAEGVTVGQDWTAFGQRATFSGTTVLRDVAVTEDQVVRGFFAPEAPTTFGAFGQVMHAAVDVGIARAALEDATAFVRDRSRPWFEAGVERAAQEPHLILQVGRLATRVRAAEALLRRAGELLDVADAAPADADAVNDARIAVAEAKAFGGDVALQAASELFELAGASATDEQHGLDRHWRNARTHTVHDPNRWRYHHVGAYALDGTPPASAFF